MKKILIAEDDSEIAMLEQDYLEINDFSVTIVADGNKVMETFRADDYSLIILDIMLPGKNGYNLCKEIREISNVPIILATAKQDSIDKIRGLGLGADDYITKPFDPAEMVARVKAHLARYDRLTGNAIQTQDDSEIIEVKDLTIYLKSWKVMKSGVEIKLPNREFELLRFLAQNPNIVFTKDQLLENLWGYDSAGYSATVTVHINRLREKIETDPANPIIIETVWGAGYRLNN